MAARTIGMDELGAAVKEYAARHDLTMSSNEKGFCLMPGDVVIALQDGKPSCPNAEILDSLIEILMDLAEEPTRAPQKPNLPARPTSTKAAPRRGQDGPLTKEDIINYINPKATEQEAYLFAEFCKRKGADPLTKQVYLVIYEGQNGRQANFIAGKEYFTEKAEAHPQFDLKKFEQYYAMVDGFESNCIGCGIQVWHLGYNQFPRLLLRVRKILEGGDLTSFVPKPADGERQTVGLSILAGRGVGPKMAANILKKYNLCLILRDGYCGDLEDCEGIGPKRAETIRKNLEVLD